MLLVALVILVATVFALVVVAATMLLSFSKRGHMAASVRIALALVPAKMSTVVVPSFNDHAMATMPSMFHRLCPRGVASTIDGLSPRCTVLPSVDRLSPRRMVLPTSNCLRPSRMMSLVTTCFAGCFYFCFPLSFGVAHVRLVRLSSSYGPLRTSLPVLLILRKC